MYYVLLFHKMCSLLIIFQFGWVRRRLRLLYESVRPHEAVPAVWRARVRHGWLHDRRDTAAEEGRRCRGVVSHCSALWLLCVVLISYSRRSISRSWKKSRNSSKRKRTGRSSKRTTKRTSWRKTLWLPIFDGFSPDRLCYRLFTVSTVCLLRSLPIVTTYE